MENKLQTNPEYESAKKAGAFKVYLDRNKENLRLAVISSALNDTCHVISNQYSTYSPKTGRNYIIDG